MNPITPSKAITSELNIPFNFKGISSTINIYESWDTHILTAPQAKIIKYAKFILSTKYREINRKIFRRLKQSKVLFLPKISPSLSKEDAPNTLFFYLLCSN